MQPSQAQLIYEGKAKKIFSTNETDQVLIEFKDDATAFNALKHSQIDGKGLINCQISSHLFEFLEKNNISTHYLGLLEPNKMLAKCLDIIPLEVVVRNIAAGSLCKETPLELGVKLSTPLLDYYYKDDNLGDPILTDARISMLGLITPEQKIEIENLTYRINDLLQKFLCKLDLILVDFKLEFGVDSIGKIILADEISPDNCRIWDQRVSDPQKRILDKDRFRMDLGDLVVAYAEILKRIQEVPTKSLRCS